MGCFRALICIIFPPLAVIDRGCGTFLIVLLLTIAGWIPGVIAALLLNFMADNKR
ncbi:MAG TPA: YqaE/Pmp3 family membrane protein [Phototrophicaceae bacterium]|nr:YqaE/Pmp3 family membrane protein [Phototrophicaceae bacterium]